MGQWVKIIIIIITIIIMAQCHVQPRHPRRELTGVLAAPFPVQLLTNATRQSSMTTQVLGHLPSTWETCTVARTSPQPVLTIVTIWEVNQGTKAALSLPIRKSAFQIKEKTELFLQL